MEITEKDFKRLVELQDWLKDEGLDGWISLLSIIRSIEATNELDDPVAKGVPYPGMEWDHPDQKPV